MVATQKQPLSILPLENDDRLTRNEFERRYQAMPSHQKAELIEEKVFVASPVRARKPSVRRIYDAAVAIRAVDTAGLTFVTSPITF